MDRGGAGGKARLDSAQAEPGGVARAPTRLRHGGERLPRRAQVGPEEPGRPQQSRLDPVAATGRGRSGAWIRRPRDRVIWAHRGNARHARPHPDLGRQVRPSRGGSQRRHQPVRHWPAVFPFGARTDADVEAGRGGTNVPRGASAGIGPQGDPSARFADIQGPGDAGGRGSVSNLAVAVEADGTAPAAGQVMPVVLPLAHGPVPVPDAIVQVTKDQQVLEFLNLGKAHSRRGGNGPVDVDRGADLRVPPVDELAAKVGGGRFELKGKVDATGALEGGVDYFKWAVCREDVRNTLSHFDAVHRAEKNRLIVSPLIQFTVAESRIHVVEENDAASGHLKKGLDRLFGVAFASRGLVGVG